MTINNVSGMNAYNYYTDKKKEKEESMEKLSSGLQINSAADNAAGLAISEKMRAEITINQANQFNAKTASNAVNVAEGAMQSINDMLIRATDLAAQSANGTYTEVERGALQMELDAITSEINRVAQSTNFNGISLLDGTYSTESGESIEFAIDSNGGNISLAIDDVSIDPSQMNIVTQEQAQEMLDVLSEFVNKITSQRGDLGAVSNRLDYSQANLSNMEIYLQQAESQIRDTDMAKESTENSNKSLGMNASISSLKQAQEDKEYMLGFLGS